MDCNEIEELLVPYLLDALSPAERESVEFHVESCQECSLRLQGDGETVARLALAVPQLAVPARVKESLFSRIGSLSGAEQVERRIGVSTRLWLNMGHNFLPRAATVAASVLVIALAFGGVWFNNRLNEVSEKNKILTEQVEKMAEREIQITEQVEKLAEREVQIMEMVRDQRYLSYEALRMTAGTTGAPVNMLWSTGSPSPPGARGVMMFSQYRTFAILLALNLPPLPGDQAYQVWLIRGDKMNSAGLFTVDSTGYGQAVIIPVAPFAEFDAVGITIEPAGGSSDPTGENILEGDL